MRACCFQILRDTRSFVAFLPATLLFYYLIPSSALCCIRLKHRNRYFSCNFLQTFMYLNEIIRFLNLLFLESFVAAGSFLRIVLHRTTMEEPNTRMRSNQGNIQNSSTNFSQRRNVHEIYWLILPFNRTQPDTNLYNHVHLYRKFLDFSNIIF